MATTYLNHQLWNCSFQEQFITQSINEVEYLREWLRSSPISPIGVDPHQELTHLRG